MLSHMKTTTEMLQTAETMATAKASSMCDAALETIAKGRKTFVKGKPVFVPFSSEKRDEIKGLQLSLFTAENGFVRSQAEAIVGDVDALFATMGEDAAQDLGDEIVAAYCAAGRAEIERRFAEVL